jgi:pilus assembly protein CpaB
MKQKIILVISIVFGLIAAVITRTYLTAKEAEYNDLKKRFLNRYGTMEVLCFNKDLPGGTTLSQSDIGIKTVPKSGLRGQALTEANVMDVIGRKIISGHSRGEVLFWSDIEGGNPVSGGLASDIRSKMRAVSINASGAAAVSGMVRPNDHVDVIGTFSFPGKDPSANGAQELVTYTILQNVLVLATGKQTAKTPNITGSFGSPSASYSTVTLEVTPREAEMLVFAEQIKGRLSLALRNRNDTYYEKELPKVDFHKIQSEIEKLNNQRQAGRIR